MRLLADGSQYEVVKNFSTEAEFRRAVAGRAGAVRFEQFEYFWGASSRSLSPAGEKDDCAVVVIPSPYFGSERRRALWAGEAGPSALPRASAVNPIT